MQSKPQVLELRTDLPSRLRKILFPAAHHIPLAPFTTWRIGGAAERLLRPHSVEEAAEMLAAARGEGWPVFFLGRGSNLLIDDAGLPGLTLHLAGSLQWLKFGQNTVMVGAGVYLPRLAATMARRGWTGFEFLIGIPGTVGGAVRLNAGIGAGREISDILKSVTVLTPELELKTLTAGELGLGYRQSHLLNFPRWLVVEVEFHLQAQAPPKELQANLRRIIQQRQAKFPPEKLTCGSVFKNPPQGPPAGWLIDRAGFKGKTIGDAQVSTHHANFIINRGRATAIQVKTLVADIQEAVWKLHNVHLKREVVFLPDDFQG
ncbi:MAG TPA: UDP-N-acetylenolpyruvoylglucosamine reductase [Desulfobacterales bacterium]|nr:UDP-N-acetylenolpyruvoylglucosamine reductase [Desulfobacterales bacterium]